MIAQAKKKRPCIQIYKGLRLKYPQNTTKDDFQVKKLFMVNSRRIAIHINNKKQEREYLVYPHQNDIFWHPLRLTATVKQLNKNEFIVLYHDDGSVDKIEIEGGKPVVAQLRYSQLIIVKSFETELFVFNENRSFCVVEKYKKNTMKLIYYKQKEGCFQVNEQITTNYCNPIHQINEKSLIGWFEFKGVSLGSNRNEKREYLILINFESKNNKYIELPIPNPFSSRQARNGNEFYLTFIRQISDEIYVCMSNNFKYWFYDTTKLQEPGCLRKIDPSCEDNERLFDYKKYNTRVFGRFLVYRQQKEQVGYKRAKIDMQNHVFLVLLKRPLYYHHNPNVDSHSYVLYSQLEQTQIKLQFSLQLDLRDVFMQLLLHINQDFDDDLLQDAIELAVK